ncbi:MAG: ABC transporter ATP-binding protein [Rhodobiaceae bacterium]|nr:ABC transporter ATP-binding protein [Rhodobiaceae bacterium]
MSSDVLISTRGLGKAYGRYENEADRVADLFFGTRRGEPKWALRDVDIEIRRGEAVGIVGRNGSGKSTLLQLICGTLAASCGSVQVHGRVAALLELGAGFHPDFTGRENARFAATILGLSDHQFEERMAAIEAFAGIGSFIDQPIREYSSGMFARLAFSVAIHVDTDILVVDEILAVGDMAFQQKCLRYLRRFCERGGTLLFVSHDDSAVRALCNRAIWLDQGRIEAEGRTPRVCRLYHAAMSKLAGDGDSFSIGGIDDDEGPVDGCLRRADLLAPAPGRFDPDGFAAPSGGGEIAAIKVVDGQGRPMAPAHGGQEVEIRITCRAARALTRPSVCFLVRDKFAQVLFGDRTPGGDEAPAAMAAGEERDARFVFTLPFLPSNDYVVEALLLEQGGDGDALVARAPKPFVLTVSTAHISYGLANIAMREVSVQRLGAAVS